MPFTQEQIGRIFAEKDSERVTLTCPKHGYVASKLPPNSKGCKDCWLAYYVFDLASTPPHLRQERLAELDAVIHHVEEFIKNGKFDFKPEFNPTVKFIKDGYDDAAGDYKPDIEITDKDTN